MPNAAVNSFFLPDIHCGVKQQYNIHSLLPRFQLLLLLTIQKLVLIKVYILLTEYQTPSYGNHVEPRDLIEAKV